MSAVSREQAQASDFENIDLNNQATPALVMAEERNVERDLEEQEQEQEQVHEQYAHVAMEISKSGAEVNCNVEDANINDHEPTTTTTTTTPKTLQCQQHFVCVTQFIASDRTATIIAIAVCFALMMEGLYCFADCERRSIRTHILSLYYMLLGLMTIMYFAISAKHPQLSEYVRFVRGNGRKSFWFFLLGSIAFGNEWWSCLVGFLLWTVSALYAFRSYYYANQKENISAADNYNINAEIPTHTNTAVNSNRNSMQSITSLQSHQSHRSPSTHRDSGVYGTNLSQPQSERLR